MKPFAAASDGIVIHDPMPLGGSRPHEVIGVAVGFDAVGRLLSRNTTDELELPDAGRRRLAAELRRCADMIERGGANLH